jgi:hypothetical protein
MILRSHLRRWLLANLALVLLCASLVPAYARKLPPIADVHLHYTWDQVDVTSPRQAVAALKRNNVVLAVVTGTPPDLALEIARAGGDRIVPIYGPYLSGYGRRDWFTDPRTLRAARAALASGKYFGIGEVHLRAGLGPRRDNPIFTGLIELAIEHDVPVLIHTESSSHLYFQPLCQNYSKARFLWAHAGGLLNASQVGTLMKLCPNVWVELSARDRWRYTVTPIVDDQGRLLPEWEALLKEYPQRFMIGSDTVWPVDPSHRWDESDTGWKKIDDYLGFHRHWLSFLPEQLARQVRLENAQRFFHQDRRKSDG